MYNKNVPNGSTECTKLEMNPYYHIDDMLMNIIDNAIKGSRQMDIAWCLINDGYVFYDDMLNYSHKTFDNYIERVQKKFRDIEYLNINVHIYYGQIGANNEFGYYLQVVP